MSERSFNVQQTLHTSYTVSDLNATVDFYRDCMGFTVRYPDPPTDGYMEAITGLADATMRVAIICCPDGHQIELFEYSTPKDRQRFAPRPCDTGASHMAFGVDDFGKALAEMEEYGFRPIAGKPDVALPGGTVLHTAYLRNADGLLIEIVQKISSNRS